MVEEALLLVVDEGKRCRNNRRRSLGRQDLGHPEDLEARRCGPEEHLEDEKSQMKKSNEPGQGLESDEHRNLSMLLV